MVQDVFDALWQVDIFEERGLEDEENLQFKCQRSNWRYARKLTPEEKGNDTCRQESIERTVRIIARYGRRCHAHMADRGPQGL